MKRHWLYGEVNENSSLKIKRKNSKGWFPSKCVQVDDQKSTHEEHAVQKIDSNEKKKKL